MKKNSKWLPNLWFIYFLPAFLWWAFLLWRKNDTVFELERKILLDSTEVMTDQRRREKIQEIDSHHRRQQRMIIAEGVVFMGLLVFGLHRIRKSFQREVELVRQHRNFQLSVTHELKSPIAGIQLALETLLRRDFAPEKSREIQIRALQDTKRLDALVENVLFSARLEDFWEPNMENIDLKALLTEVAEAVGRNFKDSNIDLDISENLPLLLADKQGLRSVFSNLIENALKYSKSEDVTVPLCRVRAFSKAGSKITIEFSDSGVGILPREKTHIFEKFYRSGNELTRQTKGTGLGLYIVKKVLDAHSARVEVRDNVPQGTIFSLHFG